MPRTVLYLQRAAHQKSPENSCNSKEPQATERGLACHAGQEKGRRHNTPVLQAHLAGGRLPPPLGVTWLDGGARGRRGSVV